MFSLQKRSWWERSKLGLSPSISLFPWRPCGDLVALQILLSSPHGKPLFFRANKHLIYNIPAQTPDLS